MSIFKAVQNAMKSHGKVVSVNVAVAERATTADVASKANATAYTALNKATKLKHYGFANAEIDWNAVQIIVDGIGADRLGIHESRKIAALRDSIKARQPIGAECRVNLPLLKAASESESGILSKAVAEREGSATNHRTFLIALKKAGLLNVHTDSGRILRDLDTGKGHIGYSVRNDTLEKRVFWTTVFSIC